MLSPIGSASGGVRAVADRAGRCPAPTMHRHSPKPQDPTTPRYSPIPQTRPPISRAVSYNEGAGRFIRPAPLFAAAMCLLPLDRAGGLGGDVVDDAVDPLDLVDDPVAHPREDVVGDPRPVGSHRVLAGDGADGADLPVGAEVAHHADGADRQEDGEELPDRAAEPRRLDLVAHDRVGAAEGRQVWGGDVTEEAHREAGTGERLALDDLGGEAEFAPDRAHLVFEEEAQRLDQLELHIGRQPADIVVGLDLVGHAGILWRRALDHVGVEGPLRQELERPRPGSVRLEDADEGVADPPPLLLGVADPGEFFEELSGGVCVDERHPEVAPKNLLHRLRLALAQQPVVDEDRREAVADGAVDQRRRDRGIDPTGEAAEDAPLVADLRADLVQRRLDEVRRGPRRGAAADLVEEGAQEFFAARRVRDLGVELDPVIVPPRVGHRRVRRVGADRDRREVGRQRLDPVAVAHPDVDFVWQAGEDPAIVGGCGDVDLRRAVLAVLRRGDAAAERVSQQLHPVADPEDRDAAGDDPRGELRRARLVDRVRPTGEDNAARLEGQRLLGGGVERQHLAIDRRLADAAGDQLAVLRAEIEDDDGIEVGGRFGGDDLRFGVRGLVEYHSNYSASLAASVPVSVSGAVALPRKIYC